MKISKEWKHNNMGSHQSRPKSSSSSSLVSQDTHSKFEDTQECIQNLEECNRKLAVCQKDLIQCRDKLAMYDLALLQYVLPICSNMLSLSNRFVNCLRHGTGDAEDFELILEKYLQDLNKLDGVLSSRFTSHNDDDGDQKMVGAYSVDDKPSTDVAGWIYLYSCLMGSGLSSRKLKFENGELENVWNDISICKQSIAAKLNKFVQKGEHSSYTCLYRIQRCVDESLQKISSIAEKIPLESIDEPFNFPIVHPFAADFVKTFQEGVKLLVYVLFWDKFGKDIKVADTSLVADVAADASPEVKLTYRVSFHRYGNTKSTPAHHHRGMSTAQNCKKCGLKILP
jgi:hypothetical protein